MNVPILETERLRLRGHRRDDFNASAAMWGDENVTRYIAATPSTREESWSRMLRLAGLWPLLGYGYWLIEDKRTGAFVGEGGFADFQRDVTPSFDGAPEQGWVLAASTQAKGYATEAGRAALDWADAHLARDFVCMIKPQNTASIKVACKLGYGEYARTQFKTGEIILFRRQTRSLT